MSVKVRSANVGDIPSIITCMRGCGLGVNEEKLRRYFFSPEVPCSDEGGNGGFVAEDAGGTIVGYCGLTPCPLYRGQSVMPALQMGVLGLKQGFGAAMFDLMDAVVALSRNYLVYANTANAKSGELWVKYAGFQYGPESGGNIQYDLLPLGLMTPRKFDSTDSFHELLNSDFWLRYLESCSGWSADRSPARLERLFGGAVEDGRVSILLEREVGRVVGVAVLHARPFLHGCKVRYAILDLVAIKDNREVLSSLVRKVRRFAMLHGGVMIEYVGGVEAILSRKRRALNNTFISSKPVEGWFYGPFDGDRSRV